MILFGLVTCPQDQRLKVQADRERGEDSLTQFFFIYSNLLSIKCFFPTLNGTSRPREREEDSLTQFLSLSLLISVFTYLGFVIYVIIDIWRQGLFIFMSDHLHILSSSYLAKSWSYCNSVFFIVFSYDQTGQRKPFDAKEVGGTVKLSRLC